MVKVNLVFKNASLQKLSKEAKLLYIYLITNPEIDILGVCSLNVEVSALLLDITIQELRAATTELIKNKLIMVFSDGTALVYFLVLGHYDTQPKGTQTLKKATDTIKILPEVVRDYIEDNFDLEAKSTVFVEPTVQEIEDFATSVGFSVDGQTILDYYRGRAEFYRKKVGWWDGKGKQVIDWKRKVRNVWCKDSNKLKENPDAPEGLKYFHVMIAGKQVYPDYWKEGKPYSRSGIIETTELQEAYERKKIS